MGPLKAAAAAFALLLAAPATASPVDPWRPLIAEASQRFGIPEEWIVRVMRAESGGRTTLNGRPITSHAGAMGLMQVMPGTYREMARVHRLGADPYLPRDNIMAGTAYLRAMYDRYGYPGLFAAYNAGPGRYEEYLRGRRALPGETRAYLAQVTSGSTAPAAAAPAATLVERAPERLFFTLRTRGPVDDPEPESVPASPLFVRSSAAPRAEE
jgi:soluble lytic murein transglycosylase-like protein